MQPHGLWFSGAPAHAEDVDGLAHVAHAVTVPVAAGEEWRTVYDALPRITRRACAILQPEMGHKGSTEFMRIAAYAQAHHLEMIPHATDPHRPIPGREPARQRRRRGGDGARVPALHLRTQPPSFLVGDMDCSAGAYTLPSGCGFGVEPSVEALSLLES